MIPIRTIAHAHKALVDGTVTSRSLVEASLAAISARNRETNAFISVAADRALALADRADQERAAGIITGPLHGIPISIKDLIDQKGVVTTAASHVLDERIAPADATVVSRLEEAGAIIIGRTNLHQFALGTTSDDSAFGPVRNPHDLTRSAGGSSGGSAAAVAMGMGLASVGTDTGASVRVPAAICGVVGLKPSHGDVPTTGVIPLSTTFDHVGPIANSVQDAAWMWQIMSARPAAPVRPVPTAGLRFATLGGVLTRVLEPTVQNAMAAAEGRLRDAGITLHHAELAGAEGAMAAYGPVVLAEGAAWHAPYLNTKPDKYSPLVFDRLNTHGRAVTAVAYLDALAFCRRLRESVDALLDEADALVLPTVAITAPVVGEREMTLNAATGPEPVRSVMLRLTQIFNMTGHPAISLPIPSPGLPVGLQIVGRRGATMKLLAVAAAIEAVIAGNSTHA